MQFSISDIPPDAITLHFLAPGEARQFPDGLVHGKIVPCTVFSQVLFGTYEITCGGHTETIHPGEAFLTPANRMMTIVHHADAQRGWMGARWLHFHFTLFGTVDFTSLLNLPLRLEARSAEQMGKVVEKLLREDAPKIEDSLAWLAWRQERAFAILRILCACVSMRPDSLGVLQHSERLTAVFSYIQSHMAEPVDVRHLADLAHMSRSRFHAFFKAHMGTSPMEYVKQIRLNEACKLLMASDYSIAEIALRVGFCNPFHFSREFKGHFLLSPSHYRQSSAVRYGDVLTTLIAPRGLPQAGSSITAPVPAGTAEPHDYSPAEPVD